MTNDDFRKDADDFWREAFDSQPPCGGQESDTVLKLKSLYRKFASLAAEVDAKTFINNVELLDFEAILGLVELMQITVKDGIDGKDKEYFSKEAEAIENIKITVGGLKKIYEDGIRVDPPWSLAVLAQFAFVDFVSDYKNVGTEAE